MNTAHISKDNFFKRMCSKVQEEHGNQILEFALTAMIMLMLTFGMIDFSRFVYTSSVVRAAAQEGARAGIVDLANAETAAKDKMALLDTDAANVVVSKPDDNTVQVEVSYAFEFITPIIANMVNSGTIEVDGTASMIIH